MQGTDEQRVVGHVDAASGETATHVGLVEQRREQTGVALPGVPPAGAALQRARVGIVGGARPVTAQHDDPPEPRRQRHPAQRPLGRRDAFGHLGHRVESRGRVGRRGRAIEPGRVAQQLDGVDRPHRLDEGEGGHRRELEPSPGAPGARRDPRVALRSGLLVRTGARRERRVQEHRQTVFAHVGREAPVGRGEPRRTRRSRTSGCRRRALPGRAGTPRSARRCRTRPARRDGSTRSRTRARVPAPRRRSTAARRARAGRRARRLPAARRRRRPRRSVRAVPRARRGPRARRPRCARRGARTAPPPRPGGSRAARAAWCPRRRRAPPATRASARTGSSRRASRAGGGSRSRARRPAARAGHRASEQRLAAIGRVEHVRGEAAETGDLGRQVVRRERAPLRPGASRPRRGPERLTLVEVAAGPGADPLADQRGPVGAPWLPPRAPRRSGSRSVSGSARTRPPSARRDRARGPPKALAGAPPRDSRR